jgi:hypothetical protein
MELKKIEFGENNYYAWISFPEVARVSVSIEIDYNIFINLSHELEWAEKNSVKYTNLKEVRKFILSKVRCYYIDDKDVVDEFKEDRKTYLMKDKSTNLYKIGFSKNPLKREKTLQSQKPCIEIVKIWNKNIEKELHNTYHKNRVRGEWFDLTNIQVKYICTHF